MNFRNQHLSKINEPAKVIPTQIDRLYKDFQDLKQRIRSKSSSRRRQDSCYMQPAPKATANKGDEDFLPGTLKKVNLDSLKHQGPQTFQIASSYIFTPQTDTSKKPSLEQEGQESKKVQLILEEYQNVQMTQNEAKLTQHIDRLQGKIKICEELIRGLATIVKMKKTSRKTLIQKPKTRGFNENIETQGQQNLNVIKLIQEYEGKIETISKFYDEKIKKLEKQNNKDRQTSSTMRNSSKSQLNQFESLLLGKDHQISVLKLQNTNLRKAHDRILASFNLQNKKHQELEKRLKIYAQKKSGNKIQVAVQTSAIKDQHQNQIKSLQHVVYCKDQQIEYLNQELQEKNHEDLLRPPALNEQNDPRGHQSERQDIRSKNAKKYDVDFQMCKSQVLEPTRTRKRSQELKKLQAQIQLISQQNKHLEAKQHFLESQFNTAQADEDRFQQQSAIYKNQIRRLTTSLKVIDELSVSFLNNKQVTLAKVEQLADELSCKKILKVKCKQQK